MPAKRRLSELAKGHDTGVGEIVPAGKLRHALPQNPDATPAEHRYVAPGHVLLEWVGEHGPLAYQKLRAGVQLGIIPKDLTDAWEVVADRAMWFTRIPGVMRREMLKDRDGVSQDYCWGPNSDTWIQEVVIADADHILSGPNGHEFRMPTYEGKQPSDWDPIERFIAAPLRATGRAQMADELSAKVRSIVSIERDAQSLNGIEYIGGGKTGRGTWTPT